MHTRPSPASPVYVVFGLGALIGTVLLGAEVLRQRAMVPAWSGGLFARR